MPRGKSLSCFSTQTNSSSTVTYNTVYTNIDKLLAKQNTSKSDDIIKRRSVSAGRLKDRQKASISSDDSIRRASLPKGKLRERPIKESTSEYNHTEKILELYPWYHGKIDRLTAEKMVLGQEESENGTFIVRKSGTRIGQHVITFNNNAQATHMQFNFDHRGHCKLKGQWFETVFDMLEYFRLHPIPVESARHAHVTLASYVSNLDTLRQQSRNSTSAT